jgi:hypothetical protein
MTLNPYIDNCTCGSGQILVACCLKDCRPARGLPVTGRSNTNCYAASLGDCSATISREHYITQGVLKLIGDPITVGGFPWLCGKEKTLATKGLTAKILCDRHNSALAGLDEVGIRFFERIRAARFEKPLSDSVVSARTAVFRGEMVELWMLKILCGLIVSGNAMDRSGARINVPLPSAWLEILFDHRPMPCNRGLYMPGAVGHEFGGGQPNRLTVIYESGVVNGLIIVLDHLGFALVMNNPPSNRAGTLLEQCAYRPGEIVINSKLRQDILRLFWERTGVERSITIG